MVTLMLNPGENFCFPPLKSYVSALRVSRGLRNAPRGKPTALLSTFHLFPRSAPHVSNFSGLSWKRGGEAAFTCALHRVSAGKRTSSPTAPSKFSCLCHLKNLERVRSSLLCCDYNRLHLHFSLCSTFESLKRALVRKTVFLNACQISYAEGKTCFSDRKQLVRRVKNLFSNISFLLLVQKSSQCDLVSLVLCGSYTMLFDLL